jgi:NAD(P)-dependent dehydrogenase (short-subunit alcohol dehydrogenase family)
MFAPSQQDVRQFFCTVYAKQRDGRVPLEPMEALAAQWIDAHPEYHADLTDEAAALAAQFTVEDGRTNPFLHLAMHLSLSEQASIDQPRGVRAAVEQLAARHGSLHAAHHQAMECLGEMVWASQRSGLPPDGLAFLECLRRRAST